MRAARGANIAEKVIVSTSHLNQPPTAPQVTEVALWGRLTVLSRSRVEDHSAPAAHLEGGDTETEDADGVPLLHVHEGSILPGIPARAVVLSVAVGSQHVLLLATCGVFAFGSNARGQLGLGDQNARTEAVMMASLHLPECPTGHGMGRNIEEAAVLAVACGREHSLLLAESTGKARHVFACGAYEVLGVDDANCDQLVPQVLPQANGAVAVAARGNASCAAARCTAGESAAHIIFCWGEVSCCSLPAYFDIPTPCFRLPKQVTALSLGSFFCLALDVDGAVYAWGDGTYGELGGAAAPRNGSDLKISDGYEHLPWPGRVLLPDSPRVVDISCGERHSLVLDDRGRVFSFGENLAGQCGIPDQPGIMGSPIVPRPCLVQLSAAGASQHHEGPAKAYELGSRVFAGKWHSAVVTRDRRLYLWGHPGNRKLGHAGFNKDGSEAGEAASKQRPPGVAVRSALRDAVRRPQLIYALLHRQVQVLGLGDESTVIVTGTGERDDADPCHPEHATGRR